MKGSEPEWANSRNNTLHTTATTPPDRTPPPRTRPPKRKLD